MFPVQIPSEILAQILDQLPFKSQLAFSQTCREANRFLNDEHFWTNRIKALCPFELNLAPTKANFMKRLSRIQKEVAFFDKHYPKILAMIQIHPLALAHFNVSLARIKELMKNPWGESYIEKLKEINQLLTMLNAQLIEIQLLSANRTYLKLSYISRFPEHVITNNLPLFSQLERLELKDNLLETLPTTIGLCKSLTSLDVYDNPIIAVPASLNQLQNLHFLYFSGGNTPTMPDAIYQLKSLKWLSYDNMQLKQLSPNVALLQSLTWLYLRNNHLTQLPEELVTLKKLKDLYLENNHLLTTLAQSLLRFFKTLKLDLPIFFVTQPMDLDNLNERKTDDIDALADTMALLTVYPKSHTEKPKGRSPLARSY